MEGRYLSVAGRSLSGGKVFRNGRKAYLSVGEVFLSSGKVYLSERKVSLSGGKAPLSCRKVSKWGKGLLGVVGRSLLVEGR